MVRLAIGLMKPVALVVCLIGGSGVAIHSVNQSIHIDVNGHPFDWCGPRVKCFGCGQAAINARGYDYRCDDCGYRCTMRIDLDTNEVLETPLPALPDDDAPADPL